MYRFIAFSDPHCDDKIKSFRKDDFSQSILLKIEELVTQSNNLNCDLYCLGDFIHSPFLSYSYLLKIIQILSKLKNNFYLILGNHDIIGHNLESYKKTAIGILVEIKLVNILTSKNIENFDIVPIHYKDSHTSDLYKTSNKSIILTHNMVLPFDSIFKSLHINVLDDVIPINSLCLIGHYHIPFTTIKKSRYDCLGSTGRISRQINDAQRTPKYALITLNNGSYTIEYFNFKSALFWKDIFIELINFNSEYAMDLSDIETFMKSMDSSSYNIKEIIKVASQKFNIDQRIENEAIFRIHKAEERYNLI